MRQKHSQLMDAVSPIAIHYHIYYIFLLFLLIKLFFPKEKFGYGSDVETSGIPVNA